MSIWEQVRLLNHVEVCVHLHQLFTAEVDVDAYEQVLGFASTLFIWKGDSEWQEDSDIPTAPHHWRKELRL
jgi:hypothetical protein